MRKIFSVVIASLLTLYACAPQDTSSLQGGEPEPRYNSVDYYQAVNNLTVARNMCKEIEESVREGGGDSYDNYHIVNTNRGYDITPSKVYEDGKLFYDLNVICNIRVTYKYNVFHTGTDVVSVPIGKYRFESAKKVGSNRETLINGKPI